MKKIVSWCNLSKFYFIYVIVIGMIFSLILPIAQTPDELVHMKQMCESFGFYGAYEQYLDTAYSYNIAESGLGDEKIDVKSLKDTVKIHFDKSKIYYQPKFNLQFVSYIAAFAGLMCGYLFDLPVVVCLSLAELFNLIFAAIIGYFAISLMPIRKEMFAALMLLPMCIHQYASINYDAELLPICFLLIAYCFYLKFEKSSIKIFDITILLLLTLLIALIKPPYALLSLLFLTVPTDKYKIKIAGIDLALIVSAIKKYWYISFILGILVATAGLYILRDQRYVSLIAASLIQPIQYLRLLYHTLQNYFEFYYISLVGNFGYLAMPLPKLFVLAIYIFMFIISFFNNKLADEDKKISIKNRILYALICFTIFNLVFIAMISHSFLINGLEYGPLSTTVESYIKIGLIEGVQGRYFIPLMPLILLCFYGKTWIKSSIVKIMEIVYYCSVAVIPFVVIYNKLW